MGLQDIQILAQLSDNLDITLRRLEEAYEKKDSENFFLAKKEILETQKKISEVLK
ncbi:MAG: hypothetical protein WC438_00290 [Candidatus Pacearchaeota archaeon]